MIDEQTKQLIIDTARIDEVVFDTGMRDGKKAHYWVVDGFAQRVHKESGHVIESLGATPKPYETEVIDATYIHCTWGCNGSKNGWFYPIVINDKQGKKDYELRSSHPKGEYYDISTFYISK